LITPFFKPFIQGGIHVFMGGRGKGAVVDTDICDDWLKNKLPNLVKNYNAEETGLLYKLMPNKTLQLKGTTKAKLFETQV
jgi:hypothetical protein